MAVFERGRQAIFPLALWLLVVVGTCARDVGAAPPNPSTRGDCCMRVVVFTGVCVNCIKSLYIRVLWLVLLLLSILKCVVTSLHVEGICLLCA